MMISRIFPPKKPTLFFSLLLHLEPEQSFFHVVDGAMLTLSGLLDDARPNKAGGRSVCYVGSRKKKKKLLGQDCMPHYGRYKMKQKKKQHNYGESVKTEGKERP